MKLIDKNRENPKPHLHSTEQETRIILLVKITPIMLLPDHKDSVKDVLGLVILLKHVMRRKMYKVIL